MSVPAKQKDQRLSLHPACDLFPPLGGDELRELSDDIKANGLLDPIVLHEGQILDGRNRYRACEMAGVEPRFREWAGEHGSPTSFVLATNLLRRHLTPSQRAAIGAEALPAFKAEAQKRMSEAGQSAAPGRPSERVGKSSQPLRASEQAGAAVGVNERYVREAAAIKDADPDLFEQVKRGEKPLKQASREVGRTFGRHYGDVSEPRERKGSPKTDERPPFEIKTERQRQLAESSKARIEKAVGTCNGIARGFAELKPEQAIAVATPEEVAGWLEAFSDAISAIRALTTRVKEATQ